MTSPHHLCTPQMETGRFFFNRQQDAKYLATPSRCRPRTFGSTVWNHGSSQTNRKVRVELISCWPAAFCLSDNQFIVKILLVFFFFQNKSSFRQDFTAGFLSSSCTLSFSCSVSSFTDFSTHTFICESSVCMWCFLQCVRADLDVNSIFKN